MRLPFYRMVYHQDGWTVADAFRPQPGWGTRTFTVAVADMGEHTEHQVMAMARQESPPRHRLTSFSIFPADGEERVIWSTAPDPTFEAKTAVPA